jgi:phosphatidylserine/phosphatidylglycerophosphate/cardiolipin synthase-like enzyme
MISIWAIADTRWGWAVGAGAMSLVSYLIAPAAPPPRYGLDHEFPVDSSEFLATVAGASGAPFIPGNRVELLNNGDAFYPRMLAAVENARASIPIEAYI